MKVLFISNIPAPYRVDFFNELGKYVELYVLYEAKKAPGIRFNWNINKIKYFKAIFLSEGFIRERRINFSILKHLKKNNYNIIVLSNYAYLTEMLAYIYLKFRRIPYFVEVDGGVIRTESKYKYKFKKYLLSGACLYFSPSKETDDYFMHYGVDKNLIRRYPFTSLKASDIVNHPIDNEAKKFSKKQIGLKETNLILAIGQFIYRKGFDILIQSAKDFKDDTAVIIIGGQATKEYLTLLKENNIKNVYFKDFMTKSKLEIYFKAADVFVHPTREDIWGLVINEAMACGLPVVTTDKCIAGLELVRDYDNGFIVQAGNIKELANKIKLILNDEQLKSRMSKSSIEKIEWYTLENMAKVHIDIISNCRLD